MSGWRTRASSMMQKTCPRGILNAVLVRPGPVGIGQTVQKLPARGVIAGK